MAQFRGTIEGARGSASRLGHKGSGLKVTANGWDTGARVYLDHRDGRDHVTVLRTGGSHGGPETVIAEWDEGGPVTGGVINSAAARQAPELEADRAFLRGERFS